MKPSLTFTLIGLLLLCAAAAQAQDSAQTAPIPKINGPRLDWLRVQRMAFNQLIGGSNELCIAVQENGAFHMEKIWVDSTGPSARVYEDHFTADEIATLRKLLDADDFKQLKTKIAPQFYVRSDESLLINVLRDDKQFKVQQLNYYTAEERKPHKAALKPILDWVKQIEKRKQQESKNVKPSHCMGRLFEEYERSREEPSPVTTGRTQ